MRRCFSQGVSSPELLGAGPGPKVELAVRAQLDRPGLRMSRPHTRLHSLSTLPFAKLRRSRMRMIDSVHLRVIRSFLNHGTAKLVTFSTSTESPHTTKRSTWSHATNRAGKRVGRTKQQYRLVIVRISSARVKFGWSFLPHSPSINELDPRI